MNLITVSEDMATNFNTTLFVRTLSSIVMVIFLAFALLFLGLKYTAIIVGGILSYELLGTFYKKQLTFAKQCAVIAYLGLCIFALYAMYSLGIIEGGVYYIITILLLTFTSDIGAYIFGSMLKGPKLCPRVSPTKTISGAVFAITLPVIVYSLLYQYKIIINLGYIHVAIIGFLAVMGDLMESMLKRFVGIKDFVDIIPGHGGLSDRFDSVSFVAIYVYIITFIF